jgi:hypothetical protein
MKDGESELSETATSNRRWFLAALGGISVTGLAGCAGDDGTDTPTEGEETTDTSTTTQQPTGTGPEQTDTSTETETDPDPTDTPTETEPPTCEVSEEQLLSFGGELQFEPGEEKTIVATVQNPYLFEITNGSVTLDPPNGDWTISGPANDNNTFESLGVGDNQTAEWTITASSSAGGDAAITVNTSYENCDGSQSVEFTTERTVSVDAYLGKEFTDLAAVYEYYDDFDADSDTPGDLGANSTVNVSLDLSGGEEHLSGTVDYTDNQSFQLRFGDYFESDGFGGRLLSIEILADGETVASFASGDDVESEFLVMNNGSSLDQDGNRFADTSQTWTYQFPVPEGTSELIANIDIENQFTIEGRGGASRDGGGTANARIAHMSPDAPNVDVYVDGGDPVLTDVPFGAASDYLEVPAGDRQVEITEAGNADNSVFDNILTVEADTDYTAVAVGHLGDGDQPFEVLTFVDDNSNVGDSDARLRAIHVSPDAPAVDVTAGGGSPVLFDGVAYGGSGYTTVEANDYTVEIRDDTDSNDGDVVADFDVSLNGGTVYTAFAAGNLDPSNSPGDEGFDLIVAQDSTDDN